MADIRVCVNCTNTLGEGPLWDVEEQRLYWLDGMKGQILRCAADGSDVTTWELPGEIGSMALRTQGGALVALSTGLHFFDFDSGKLDFICHPEEGKENVRLNDGKVDSRGRFVVGSLDMGSFEPGAERRGTLYRLDPDLSLHRLDDGISVSNGPCWSPDGATFYFTDSSDDAIRAYDWDLETGAATNKRIFTQLATASIPDGGTVDAEGYVWTAANGAFTGVGELRRYAPDGTLDRTVAMPTPKPTSLMFGGPELDILYVTSMNIPGEVAETPFDGKLFAVHGLGIRGLPEYRFGG